MKCLKCGKEFDGKENSNLCLDCAFDIVLNEVDREYINYLIELEKEVRLEKLATMEWR